MTLITGFILAADDRIEAWGEIFHYAGRKVMTRKLCLVLLAASFLVGTGLAGTSSAGVNINIGLGLGAPIVYPAPPPPPPVAFAAPPDVMVIPGTYIYFVPGVQVDVFFYDGWWWRPWQGHWYRSYYYGGPWRYAVPARVPRALGMLPPGWRSRWGYGAPGLRPIPYGQLRHRWKRWQSERYWDRQEGWRRGRGRGDEGDEGRGDHGDRGMGRGRGRGWR